MRETFSAYYPLSEGQFKTLWREALLVFDTNVLFGLYRYSQETSDELLALFKKLNSRLFLPYQVALEYHRNRTEIIGQQCKIYSAFIAEVEKAFNKIKGDLKSKKHPFITNTDQVSAEFDKLFTALSEQIRERQNSIEKMLSDDRILAELTKLFANRVGKKYSRDELERIYSEGDKRYHLRIPPGYSDEKKPEEQKYGDLIIWYQILDVASTKKKPVIFVTEDEKKDWWWRIGDRIVGPRPELVEEMKERASVSYYSYSLEPFMKHTKKYLKETIDQRALSEITERSKLKTRLMSDYIAQLESIRNSIDFSALAKYGDRLISMQNYYTPEYLERLNDIQKSLSSIDFIPKYLDILPQSTWGLPGLHGMAQQDSSILGEKPDERQTENGKQQKEDEPNDEEENESK